MSAHRLSAASALFLTLAPLLWAGNAVAGRLLTPLVAPVTLNFLRWALAALVLLPLAWGALREPALRQAVRAAWRPLALMGLLGIACYNALLYLALQTSSPVNVTLVGASLPIWMMLMGALFFKTPASWRQAGAALCSLLGVLVVMLRGQWQQWAHLQLVPGDVFMLVATLCWAGYSWLLLRMPGGAALKAALPHVRGGWAALLLVQISLGLGWAALGAAAEQTWVPWARAPMQWSAPLVAGLVFVALGPAVAAYRCWGLGVQMAGPTVAAFFSNLIPLFAALLSALLLGEMPQGYHALAFALIVAGIVISARK